MFCIFIIGLFSISLALAEENETNLIGDNSSADEAVPSKIKYGWEKFKLNFFRNQTIKVERELQLARWKIAEAKVAAKNGNVEKAEKIMEQHDAILARVQKRISNMENKSLTPGLDQALQVHEQRLVNLNTILENSNLTDAQRVKIENRIAKLDNKTSQLEELRETISQKRQEKLERLENRTEKIEERGNRVQQRIENKINKTNSNNNSEDDDLENETLEDNNSSN